MQHLRHSGARAKPIGNQKILLDFIVKRDKLLLDTASHDANSRMKIIAILKDGTSEVLTRNDFDWKELDFSIGLAIQMWGVKPQPPKVEEIEYWSLYSDFMIKYKNIELPIWHVHSFLNFLENGRFLDAIPRQAESERKIRALLVGNLNELSLNKEVLVEFIGQLLDLVSSTRVFRNKLIHRPWATQGTKIGVCGMRSGEFVFEEVSKVDLSINYSIVNEIVIAMTQIYIGLMKGFSSRHSNTRFEGFSFLPKI